MINELLYQVGDYQTYSKMDALRRANGDASRVHFNFLESTFSSADWSRPKRTWDELLRERCQQIRNKYQHVALWYSGGWDSNTILQTFIKNKIRLDECIVYNREFFYDPEFQPVLQYLEQVKKDHYPNLKVTVVEISHRHSEETYHKYGTDWIYTPGCNVVIPKIHRYFLLHELSETAGLINDNINRCEVFGHDKPRLLLSHGWWYNFAPDTSCTLYMGADCEFFYLSPDLPELHIAQCHMSADFFESLIVKFGAAGEKLLHDIQSNRVEQEFEDWNLAIGRTAINNESARFGRLKPRSVQHPLGDEPSRMINHFSQSNDKFFRIYNEGLREIQNIVGYKPPDNNKDIWVKGILSKWYPVRPLNPALTHLFNT